MLLAFTAQQQHNENMSQHFDAIFENGVLKPPGAFAPARAEPCEGNGREGGRFGAC